MTGRCGQLALVSGRSKTSKNGNRRLRRTKTYKLRRSRSSTFAETGQTAPLLLSRFSSGGSSGKTDGPAHRLVRAGPRRPASCRGWPRRRDASRFCRQNSVLSGSTTGPWPWTRDDWRYVALVRISRCIDFKLQPRATSSVASQSSSSGCDGSSPIVPKSLGVPTSPLPK